MFENYLQPQLNEFAADVETFGSNKMGQLRTPHKENALPEEALS